MYGYKCEYCEGTVRPRIVERESFQTQERLYHHGKCDHRCLRSVWQQVLRCRHCLGCP
jgi:hypothetical protein